MISQCMTDGVDPEVRTSVQQYIEKLRTLGYEVDEVELPMMKYALAMYYIIVPAEVSSNLARVMGVRYGHRAEGVKTLEELYGKSRDEGFMTENKRRIMIKCALCCRVDFSMHTICRRKKRAHTAHRGI